MKNKALPFIVLGLFAGALVLASYWLGNNLIKPKYIYAVKENIVHAETWTGYELWCNYEYPNGHIERKFVGSFKMEGTGARRGYIETDLCPIKGVVSLEQR